MLEEEGVDVALGVELCVVDVDGVAVAEAVTLWLEVTDAVSEGVCVSVALGVWVWLEL